MYADMILRSDAVFTAKDLRTISGGVAVKDGRILYAGEWPEVEIYRGPKTLVLDYGSQLILPGFHDAHMHVYLAAMQDSPLVAQLFNAQSEADCVQRMVRFAETRPRGRWVVGMGWYHLQWADPSLPTRASLDKYFPDTAVCLLSKELHSIWLNSEAMRRLSVEQMEGRCHEYVCDTEGNLTGVVLDASANTLLLRALDFTQQEENDLYLHFLRRLRHMGITSVCDLSLTVTPDEGFIRGDIYKRLDLEGVLPVRVSLYPALTRQAKTILDYRQHFRGQMVRFGGGKQFFDGVSSSYTAWMCEPYKGKPASCGDPAMPERDMAELLRLAAAHDIPMRVHTIGDQAIRRMIDFREALGTSSSLVLEHLENLRAEDIRRLAKNGIGVSVQPRHAMLDPASAEAEFGMERASLMWPFRSFLDAGCAMGFGTDAPVVDPDPLRNIYAAVHRRDPDTRLPAGGWMPHQRITVSEALTAYTWGSARIAGVGDVLGSLEPGKYADIIVLNKNIVAHPDEILDARVVVSMLGGTMYELG